MENTNEVTLKLSQKELVILHTALCQHRGKVNELISWLEWVWQPMKQERFQISWVTFPTACAI